MKITEVATDFKSLSNEEQQAYIYFSRDLTKDQLAEIFFNAKPEWINFKNDLIQRYKKGKEENEDLIRQMVAGIEEYNRTGPLSDYICWKCKKEGRPAKFKAYDKLKHICPTCGTDLDEE